MTAPDLTSPVTPTSLRSNGIKDEDDEKFTEVLQTNAELAELTVVAEGEERTTWFVWLLVFCCSISGLLFGSSILFVLILLLAKIIRRL